MPHPDLPGFYFDPDKNRYFPISHQKRIRASQECTSAVSTSYQDEVQHIRGRQRRAGLIKLGNAPDDGVLGLIHQRELSGNHQYGQSSSHVTAFQGKYLEVHTVQPRVWQYSKTRNWADGGLQQLRVGLQTEEGELEADVITLGGTDGRLGVWQITEPLEVDCEAQAFPAAHCLPVNPNLWTGEEKGAPVLLPSMKAVAFPSKITSIKRLNEMSDTQCLENGKRLQQNILITTLGNGVNGGALYLLCPTQGYLPNPLQQNMCALPFCLSTSFTTTQSVWTSESNPRGKSASLGMSKGAGIVDLEKGEMSWLCRCSSDVLSQQFDSSGNVVLCGFRNGVISTIDVRLPEPQSRGYGSHDLNMSKRSFKLSRKCEGSHHQFEDGGWPPNLKKSHKLLQNTDKELRSLSSVDKLYCSHSPIMQMSSAICSLVLLRSSEWYLLASAMNGDIQQWDRRAVGRGPLRSYEGHANTHTALQLGVDPTERLLVSGGEDCAVRLWSLASGQLLCVASGLTSPVTTISWPTSFRTNDSCQWGGFWEESSFEEDNVLALWMGSSSGLHYMRGSTK